MKIIVRLLALVLMIAFVGCAAGGGGGSSSSSSSSGGLSNADLDRMGIRETYDRR